MDAGDRHIRVARASGSKRKHSKRELGQILEAGQYPGRGQLLLRAQALSSLCTQGMLLSIGCLYSRGIFYTQIPSPDKNRVGIGAVTVPPGGSCQEPLVGEPDLCLLQAKPYASVPLSIMACCLLTDVPLPPLRTHLCSPPTCCSDDPKCLLLKSKP